MVPRKILILGGTTEARQLAAKLASRRDLEVTLSLAGRTEKPAVQPVPVRVGGFGGAEGLANYLKREKIDLLVDATHPYAARMSANAVEAAKQAGVAMLALRRPAWQSMPADRWFPVEDAREAVRALGKAPRRVFLALGRQEIGAFEAAPQHAYVIRSVDPVEPPLGVPDATYILARGPFAEAGELDLLKARRIDAIVCKNSGGAATFGKLVAARTLGIQVFMFRRPALSDVPGAKDAAGLVAMIDHLAAPPAKRGV